MQAVSFAHVGVIVFTDGEPGWNPRCRRYDGIVSTTWPRRDHWASSSMPREHSSILCVGWSVKDHCWRLPLVRIDGERTTKRPPRIYHLPFKVKDRRIQGDGYVCERGGSYTYGLNHKIMTFQIWSSPTNERCHSPATSVFVKALPTYSIRDRKRCWPRIGRVAASNI